jgi:hypothetical protein
MGHTYGYGLLSTSPHNTRTHLEHGGRNQEHANGPPPNDPRSISEVIVHGGRVFFLLGKISEAKTHTTKDL